MQSNNGRLLRWVAMLCVTNVKCHQLQVSPTRGLSGAGCGPTTPQEARASSRPARQARRGSSRISSPSFRHTGVQGPGAVPPGVGAADARLSPSRSRTPTRASAWSCTTSGPLWRCAGRMLTQLLVRDYSLFCLNTLACHLPFDLVSMLAVSKSRGAHRALV
jgi:hypothetical protein